MLGALSRHSRLAAIVVAGLALSVMTVDHAEARRAGGSFGGFGSRGTRTFQAPPVTSTAPTTAAPIERSMTPRTQTNQPATAQSPLGAQQRPGLFNGFGRSMLGGLLVGGLFGMLLGHGFGGGFGFLGMLLQIALIAGAAMLAMRFFAQRRQQQPYAASAAGPSPRQSYGAPGSNVTSFRIPSIGSGAGATAPAMAPANDTTVEQSDLERFEQILAAVQRAYGAEDYAELRKLTTPEAMSYLAEELGENATKGVRNSVSDVHLLQGDVAEAWNEGNDEYATVAMRYSSIDALVDRETGRVVDGDAKTPTETTEVWTFVRRPGNDWKLSAIQAAA